MICPKCGQDTPVQKTFCVNCGGILEVEGGAVQELAESEVRLASQSALVRRAGVWLATALAFLVAAIAFRASNLEKDLPRFDEAPVLQVLDLEPQRPFPAVEEARIPVLALPVPAPKAP